MGEITVNISSAVEKEITETRPEKEQKHVEEREREGERGERRGEKGERRGKLGFVEENHSILSA